MTKPQLLTLVRFNFWANEIVLAACSGLSNNQFTQPITPNPGWHSLRGILVHALDAEYGWRMVLQGQNADTILEPAHFTNVSVLKSHWAAERMAWMAFIANLSDEDANRPKTWQTIMHVVTHGIQHRAEAATILTSLGHSPGELDFDLFLKS